jgi:hypothetical protein
LWQGPATLPQANKLKGRVAWRLIGSALQFKVTKGVNEKGQPVVGTITYNNIKPGATEQDMYDVSQVLLGLQQHPASLIQCIDYNDLEEGA